MRNLIATIVIALLVTASTLAHAEGFYTSINVNSIKGLKNDVIGGGVSIGYKLFNDYLWAELGYSEYNNFKFEKTFKTKSKTISDVNVYGHADLKMLMGKLFFGYPNKTFITPSIFIGAGPVWTSVYVTLETTGNFALPFPLPPLSLDLEKSTNWNQTTIGKCFGFELDFKLTDSLSLGTDLTFYKLGKLDIAANTNPEKFGLASGAYTTSDKNMDTIGAGVKLIFEF